MEKKLTFILPIYNVEAYLPQCIDSILDQSTEECELILVDDGATDGSGAICDRYAEAHPEIRVIHKPNGGLSSARNAGMERAAGDYVCFVDSDDYIRGGTVEKLLAWIRESHCDLCFLQGEKVFPDGSSCSMGEDLAQREIRGKSRDQVLTYLSSRPKYPGSACMKLLRRQFLEAQNIRFPGDRRLSEDLIYCLELFLRAEDFDCLEFPFYCYRQERLGSITSAVTEKYYFDTALFVEEVAARYPREAERTPEAEFALGAGAYEYAILLWQARMLREQDRAWQWLKRYRWVLGRAGSKKTRAIALAASLVGMKNTAKLLDIYQKHRS